MTEVDKNQGKNNAVTKKYTEKDAREMLQKYLWADCDPRMLMKNVANNIMPRLHGDNKAEREAAQKELMEKSETFMSVLGMENHIRVAEAVEERYRPLAIELSRQLIEENQCVSTSEKTLVHAIVTSYVRMIDSSRRLNNNLGTGGQTITENKTKYLTMLSKELDRAQRQFLNALMTLKQLKNPSLEVRVTAKTAFIANNQQINTEIHQKPPIYENIEPK